MAEALQLIQEPNVLESITLKSFKFNNKPDAYNLKSAEFLVRAM